MRALGVTLAMTSMICIGGCAQPTSQKTDLNPSIKRMMDANDQDAERTLIPPWLPTLSNPTIVTLTERQKAAVRLGAAQGLKDPASARFGTTFSAAKGDDGRVVVCGFVNAKNSFGGYVGEAPFIGVLGSGGFTLDHLSSTNMEAVIMLQHCQHLDRSPQENMKGKGGLIRAMYRES